MTGEVECRYHGRDFTADEMTLLRELISADPQPTRAWLSREFCRRIGWYRPDGRAQGHDGPGDHAVPCTGTA